MTAVEQLALSLQLNTKAKEVCRITLYACSLAYFF